MFPLSAAARIGLNVLLLLAGVVALRLGESVIVPMLIALLLASVLGPAASWLHQTLKIRWTLACISVILGMVLVNLLITLVFSAAVTRLINQLPNPNDPTKFIATYKNFRDKVADYSPWELDEGLLPASPKKVSDIGVFQYISETAPWILREVGKYTANWAWQWILILFITFFVLLEGKMLARRVVAIFGPSEDVQTKATDVLLEMATQIRTYLVWRTLINFGLAFVMGVIYYTAGLSQAVTWAILLFVLNYIPYLGPLLAGMPPFVDAFLSASPPAAVAVAAVYVFVITVEGYLVVPLLMGRNMNLNATTVMLACLFWELVWGMTGLFLAMPIMAGIKAVLYSVPDWRPWADLMSSTDEKRKHLLLPTDLPNGKPGTPHSDAERQTDGDVSRSGSEPA